MDLIQLTQQIEQISSNYAEKFDIDRDDNWFVLKLTEEVGEVTQAYLNLQKQSRVANITDEQLKIEFADEIADALGQILLLANHFEVDLETAVQRKWLKWLPENKANEGKLSH